MVSQQGSGPRVMSHSSLPDCKVRGSHYCHSRRKPVSQLEQAEQRAWKALQAEERRYDDLRLAGAWWEFEQANGYVKAKREQWERASLALEQERVMAR